MADTTIYRMLARTAQRFGARPALGYRSHGQHEYITYQQLIDRVRALRRGLAALGVRRGDRIALMSENRAEWAICDLATQGLGAVTVPIYPTLPTGQAQYIVADSAARVLVVSDKKQLAKAVELRPNVRTLETVVLMDGEAPEDVLTLAQVLEGGAAAPPDSELDAMEAEVPAEADATLIYTSGTTGDPKGAVLTHRSLLHTAEVVRQIVRVDETDVFLSFLPLCHVFERVGGHYLPLYFGALIVYSEGVFAIAGELKEVRPTVFLCVPRLYESMQEKITEQAGKLPAHRKRIYDWALRVSAARNEVRRQGNQAGALLNVKHALAEKLVLSTVRQRATGGRTRFLVSGGAPLSAATAAFMEALGLTMLEGYGLTEFPVISLNRPEDIRLGTVGPPLPGVEVRIADDGEILARGPSCMRGYFGKPGATAEAINADGWFHTGDVGELLPDGVLRITDRKKDIIVLANGKNVAPQPIEARLKQSPFVQEAVLIGDRQAAIVAIVVPSAEHVGDWARAHGVPGDNLDALVQAPDVRKLFKDEIDRCTAGLAEWERIKRFSLVAEPFTIAGGELTPTLKVRRRFVGQKYAHLIEQMVR